MSVCFLEIIWEVPNMPRHVGPFASTREAEAFARLNVPNGEWSVKSLFPPYATTPANGSQDA
jgi:hypothetical protein